MLYFAIIGVGTGLSYSLGKPLAGPFVSIPIQFVTITSLASSRMPFLSFAILVTALLAGVFGQFLTRKRPHEILAMGHGSNNTTRDYALLISSMVLAAVLVWLPRSLQSLPVGGDTLFYTGIVETMKIEGPLWAALYSDKPFFYFTMYGLQQLSGLSAFDFFRIVPVALAALATASVWFFVRAFYKEAAGLTSLLMACSIALMRTSIDLYASFLAFVLLLFFLGIYLRHRGDETRLKWKIVLQILLLLIMVSYWFVWAFLIVVLGLAEILSGNRLRRATALSSIILPSIIAMGVFVGVALTHPPPVYWGLGSSFALYLGRATTPVGAVAYASTSLDPSQLFLLGQDNLIFPILSAIGLILLPPRSFPMKTIYIWSSTMLAFSVISTTSLHAALLFPLPILAGLGLRKLVELL